MSFPWALAIPGVIFIVIIVPLWMTYHYITVWVRMRTDVARPGTVVIERTELERMRLLGEALEQRIESLETILDAEAPEWRER